MRIVIRKILSAIAVLLGVILLIFSLFILFPSAEEITAGQRADEATKAAMRVEMGLDKSKSQQLLIYLREIGRAHV